MEEGSSSGTMVKLSSDNYSIWKPRMEDILYCKDAYGPVTGEKPEGVSDSAWTTLNRKTVGLIRQWIGDSVFHHVSTETVAKDLWEKLEGLYERKTAQNKTFLIRKLLNIKYQEGSSVSEHLSGFQDCVNRLAAMKMVLDEELQALILLSSLPDSWETLVVSLSNSAPDGKVVLSTVKDSMFNEELRRKELGVTKESSAFVTETRGRSSHRNFHGDRRDKSKPRSKSRNGVTCYYCHKSGHVKADCYKLKAKNGGSSKSKGDDSEKESTTAIASNGELIIACDEGFVNFTSQDSTWVVDSAASFHVTSRRDLFSSYAEGDFGIVRMGNDGVCKISGVGDVCVETNLGCKLVLKQVRHVPDIRLHLISVGALDDDGYQSSFVGGKWKLMKGSLVVARGNKSSSLYTTKVKLCGEVNAVECNSTDLWHMRLGHMSEKGLGVLSKKNGLPVDGTSLTSCTHCLAGKQHRVNFKRNPTSKKPNILDLVHTDLCSMGDRTHGGALYFVTFVDDCSRKLWAYPLKTKDQVFEVFKQFVAEVERETGLKLKCVRSDNGGEYRGPFETFCKANGIKLERSVPKTPQQNGLAERMNRTICEKIRCMLSHSKLSKAFWGEALSTAVHLINRSPSYALDGDVPERVWKGKDVAYDYLRVFGCRAFVHIPRDERSKLDSKTKECIFLGYGVGEFGYRLWDPIEKKIVRSRDVVFFEQDTIEDIKGGDKVKPSLAKPVDLTPISSNEETNQDHAIDVDDPQEEEEPHDENPHLDDVPQEQELRRSSRERRSTSRYPSNEYVLLVDSGEPECFEEAVLSGNKDKWMEAMEDEMKSLHDNNTFDLVELPRGKKVLKNKWVFRLKSGDEEANPRYKARLVVKGFGQKKGIDFDEIFSPVVKMSSIRVMLSLAANLDLEVEQLDVKTAFLHGDLEEELYMEQPEGFAKKGKKNLVCKLKKSLYGLKQAPRNWYKRFDSFMCDNNFEKTNSDNCVFVRRFSNGDFIILLLYVDDMLVIGGDLKKIKELKEQLGKEFAMKDLGSAKQILGMRITRDRKERKLWLSQEKYIEKVLERFSMSNCKPVSSPLGSQFKLSLDGCPKNDFEKEEMEDVPYSSVVGSLMYAMVCTRPDIAHAVGVVSRFLSNPGKEHWNAVKWILRYLRGTSSQCICFGGSEEPLLEAFTDADWAGCLDSRKSTSGYLVCFGNGAVSWQSKLQKSVALSTTEAEYIAITEACKELIWMKKFLHELGVRQERYVLYCDSQSAIHLSKNPTFHSKSKHIELRYHWIRDVLEKKELVLEKVHTNENGADMLTKSLPSLKLEACCEKAGLVGGHSS